MDRLIDLLPVLLAGLLLHKCSIVKPAGALREDHLSPRSCLSARGFFAVTVIMHHIAQYTSSGLLFHRFEYLGNMPVDGIKLQLLHILKGTRLYEEYTADPFPVFGMEEYIDLVLDCVAILPESVVIHRISGDGPKSLLVAPQWSGNKRMVLNTMAKRLRERQIFQGCGLTEQREERGDQGCCSESLKKV